MSCKNWNFFSGMINIITYYEIIIIAWFILFSVSLFRKDVKRTCTTKVAD